MKMPNNTQAIIEASKISDYLLSDTHEEGKSKSAFFKRFGFDEIIPSIFEAALKNHAREREIENKTETPFGEKFQLKCDINTPDGRNPCIVTVWILENDKQRPKLITAFPGK